MEKKLTPAQQQYMDIKKQYKDAILLFRMWDFYETFYEDAKLCSKILDIALTSRDRNTDHPTPMAWVPYHSSEKYIARLIKAWYKVAIAEQMSEPKPGQIVKREVVNIITPGTYMDSKELKNYNFIAAVCFDIKYQLAFGDFSVWEYWTKTFDSLENLIKFISKINPVELVIDIDFPEKLELENFVKTFLKSFLSTYDLPSHKELFLKEILEVQTLKSFGKATTNGRDWALALLFNYLKDTQKRALKNISGICFWGDDDKIILDDITIKNLEVFSSSYEWSKKHSLIGVLDKTQTPMWWRLFHFLLTNPIKNLSEINKRLDFIDFYFSNMALSQGIGQIMSNIGDIPRVVSQIIYKKNSPFTRNRLKNIFWAIFDAKVDFAAEFDKYWFDKNSYEKVQKFYEKIQNTIKEDGFTEDMDYIRDWFDNGIDETRKIAYHSDDLLLQYQKELGEKTGINNIRIKFILNQGYFLEVSKKDCKTFEWFAVKDDERLDFTRRQTLKTAERYTTTYLDELQVKIIEAKDSLRKLEKDILEQLKAELEQLNRLIGEFSNTIWYIDIYTSYALLARQKNFCKPEFKTDTELVINWWRHIVIEEYMASGENFIPNDLYMDGESYVHIITWPNMWWKSTFLRQNAIMVLLAHCGFRVPAKFMQTPVFDGIFARIGSGDVLTKNQSTFMTEMIEVSNILHNSTKNSFIVLDELGRWTSTYDGLALAKAIVINIAQSIKAKTLFATHYHELIALEWHITGINNFSVSVYETDKEVVFLKKIIKWWANKSYWIDVAKLAGISNNIIEKAKVFLKDLEVENKQTFEAQPLFGLSQMEWEYERKYSDIKKFLDTLDLNYITPFDALQMLKKLKDDIDEEIL